MVMRGESAIDPATGRGKLSERQEAFLEWLLGDRDPNESMRAYGARVGIQPHTLSEWKRKDLVFIREWEARLLVGNAHPEKLQTLMEAAFAKGATGDTKAIELYMKLVDRMSPDRLEINTTKSAAELSDDELEALIAKEATDELASRRTA